VEAGGVWGEEAVEGCWGIRKWRLEGCGEGKKLFASNCLQATVCKQLFARNCLQATVCKQLFARNACKNLVFLRQEVLGDRVQGGAFNGVREGGRGVPEHSGRRGVSLF
jgi:hypothetical protein